MERWRAADAEERRGPKRPQLSAGNKGRRAASERLRAAPQPMSGAGAGPAPPRSAPLRPAPPLPALDPAPRVARRELAGGGRAGRPKVSLAAGSGEPEPRAATAPRHPPGRGLWEDSREHIVKHTEKKFSSQSEEQGAR